MNTNTVSLVPRLEQGWRMGLRNMLAKENHGWWRTRRWWTQCLIAISIINGTFALNMMDRGSDVMNAGLNFLYVVGIAVPFTALILGQDAILGERHSGTAAWVLSKPLRRSAFILAKLIAYGLGFLVTWVMLPGAIAYLQFKAYGLDQLSKSGYAAGMGLVYLNLLFYLTLALMLASLFNGRGPGIGIALLNLMIFMPFLSEPIMKYAPWLLKVMPWNLLYPFGFGTNSPLAGYLMLGVSLPTAAPIIATVLWCVLFTGIAIWRICREEF